MPTVRGWLVLAAGAALVAAGLAAGYRELVLVGLGAAGGTVLARLWVGAPPLLAVARTVAPQRVSRDARCLATVTLRSTGPGRPGPGRRTLAVTEQVHGPAGPQSLRLTAQVRADRPARLRYPLPTDRRGVLTVGPLLVGRRDPLGLCASQRRLADPVQVLVRPRWWRLAGIPLGTVPSLDGLLDRAQHGSIAFHALREYRPGDELRRVHWRTSARLGTLMVREHLDTALPRLTVLLDDRAESYRDDPEAFEEALEAAASVLVAADRDRLRVTLRTACQPDQAQTVDAGLDLLAQAAPAAGVAPARLRVRRPGEPCDTLIVVAGAGADLGPLVPPGAGHATLVVALLGAGGRARWLPAGTVPITARTAAELAGRWNQLATAGPPAPVTDHRSGR